MFIVYVHRDGWFLAYYLTADPVAKIFDWKKLQVGDIRHHLEAVLADVADARRAQLSTCHFYDFRYPNATHMMLIAEDTDNGNEFQVNLPGSYIYYERSWSLVSETGMWNTQALDS